jgi:hypothetical protein
MDIHKIHKRYLEKLGPHEEYVLNQTGLLRKAVDLVTLEKSSRLNTLSTLACQIFNFSRSTVLVARSVGVSEAYLLSRAILDASTNLCYLLVCDQDDFERHVDFSRRNIGRGYETTAKAFEAVGKSVGILNIRSIEPFKKVFQKFVSPKKGKDLTRWESDKSSSFEKKLGKISSKVPTFNQKLFEAAKFFIYEDASEIAHGTLYGTILCTGIFYGKEDYESAVEYAFQTITALFLLIGSLINSILLLIGDTHDIKEIIKESNNNFDILGARFNS